MKKILPFAIIAFLLITLAPSCTQSPAQKVPISENTSIVKPENFGTSDFVAEWKEIAEFEAAGRPRSALEVAEKIYVEAKKETNPEQQVKALLHILKFKSQFEEDAAEKGLKYFEEETADAYQPLKQIYQSYLAEFYYNFYLSQQYLVSQRTSLGAKAPDDINEWTANHFIDTVTKLYLASAKPNELLQKYPLENFNEILENQKQSRELRPTLFDLLAYRSLDFFARDDANLPKPVEEFLINDPAFFAPAITFISQNFYTPDSMALQYLAVKTYQEILKFHQNDEDKSAFIYADLQRLTFIHDKSIIENKGTLYYESLNALINKYPENKITSEAYAAKAQHVMSGFRPEEFDTAWSLPKIALDICEACIEKYPNTLGADNCQNLKNQIESRFFQIKGQETYLPDQPGKFLLDYKNINQISYRILALDSSQYTDLRNEYGKNLVRELDKLKPIKEETVKIPLPEDYLNHSVEIPFEKLGFGRYAIVVSADEKFSASNNKIQTFFFQVTRLSLISHTDRKKQNPKKFFVRDAKTGAPKPGVNVHVYERYYDRDSKSQKFRFSKKLKTDKDGVFQLSSDHNETYYLIIKDGKDEFAPNAGEFLSTRDYTSYNKTIYVSLFTDRSIYRPGQTVYFKGIVTADEPETRIPRLLEGTDITVFFKDVNHQKITEANFKSNEFGSFHGSFSIPTGVLNGEMTLQTNYGSQVISVEEYKRPKFEVKLDTLAKSYRLKDNVEITGNATTYSGVPLDKVRVRYRVVRKARFPFWWWSWRPVPSSAAKEIVNGYAETDEKGNFNFMFQAVPDPTIDPGTKPVFNYEVSVDVIDITGETQSDSKNISIGYVALEAMLNLPEWDNLEEGLELNATVTNLSGKKIDNEGHLFIHKLEVPERLFRSRLWKTADQYLLNKADYYKKFPHDPYKNEDQPSTWKTAETVYSQNIQANKKLAIPASILKGAGYYKLVYTTTDRYGEKAEVQKIVKVYDSRTKSSSLNTFSYFIADKTTAEPGEKVKLIWGSGDETAYAHMVIDQDGKILLEQDLKVSHGQAITDLDIKEAYRGNLQIQLFSVNENRIEHLSQTIHVPWSNKKLNIQLQTFRNKIKPGEEETWSVKITGPDKNAAEAELLASMYDASLDALKPHSWQFSPYPTYYSSISFLARSSFGIAYSLDYNENWERYPYRPGYRNFEDLGKFGFYFSRYGYYNYRYKGNVLMENAVAEDAEIKEEKVPMVKSKEEDNFLPVPTEEEEKQEPQIRTNLNETAFFFPQLKTNKKGEVIFTFTSPEALTRWKLMLLATSKDLKIGMLEDEVVTQKELMVQPNPPRFLRTGDQIQFATKLSNLSEKTISGNIELKLFDAVSMQPIGESFKLANASQSFSLKSKENKSFNWKITVPQGVDAVTYQVIATSPTHSDGEENTIPILSDRIMVTESLPLWLRGDETREFSFDKLLNSGKSNTLTQYRLTLEMSSNPSWYAVQALPYLMEYPYECAEQVFNRYYANSISFHIIQNHPNIERVFESWKNSDALLSNLQKNEDLKSVLLQETPYVLQAQDEAERKKRIGQLFDENNVRNGLISSITKLSQMQLPSGGWPWFGGMHENLFVTQYIISGFGHLNKLDVDAYNQNQMDNMTRRAIEYMDNEMNEAYEDLKRHNVKLDQNNLSPTIIQYLYARSFYKGIQRNKDSDKAFNYWMDQAKEYWLPNNLMEQSMIALALHRFGEKEVPEQILVSLDEKALHNEEMGMYWKENNNGYYWYQAPIETQAYLIEAFQEVKNDEKAVEEMKVWLLKQKQVQSWKSTKATADACYALLMQGSDWLKENKEVVVWLAGNKFDREEENVEAEAGTGYFRHTWQKKEIKPEYGKVKLQNKNESIAWGALHWQYFEQLDKITSHESPLAVQKEVYLLKNTDKGQVLEKVTPQMQLSPGDQLKIRLIVQTDRNMEFIHLKDMRAAALEPAEALSGYRYQGGLGYYQSIKDASMNFFIERLSRGTYVLEYPLRVSQKGSFQNGIATIQCMYAPEFNAHSVGMMIEVK